MSGQKSISNISIWHHALLASTKEAVPIACDPAISCITNRPRHNGNNRSERTPNATKATQHSDDGVCISMSTPFLKQQKRGRIFRIDVIFAK